MIFLELQQEVSRRALRNNATQFSTALKNAINGALLRLGREAYWRPLRKRSFFDTVTSYTTGTGAVTVSNGSKSVTVTGATFITDNVQPGRIITFGGSAKNFEIVTITGETTLTINQNYDGTSSAVETYEIYPQEEYNLPVQSTHRCFLWHEEFGQPYRLNFIQDQEFIGFGIDRTETGTPTHYRMWGTNSIIEQLKAASVVSVVSSSASDASVSVTVYGTVSGYPDQETITLNGTNAVAGTKSFSSVDRVVKNATSVGRITLTANSGNTDVAVIPVGDILDGVTYCKVQLYPLPDGVYPIKVYYYKDPSVLVNDNDVHEFGAEFDEAIICLACSKLQLETGQQEGVNFYKLYNDELNILKRTNTDKIDYAAMLKRGGRSVKSDPLIHPNLSFRQTGLSPRA